MDLAYLCDILERQFPASCRKVIPVVFSKDNVGRLFPALRKIFLSDTNLALSFHTMTASLSSMTLLREEQAPSWLFITCLLHVYYTPS